MLACCFSSRSGVRAQRVRIGCHWRASCKRAGVWVMTEERWVRFASVQQAMAVQMEEAQRLYQPLLVNVCARWTGWGPSSASSVGCGRVSELSSQNCFSIILFVELWLMRMGLCTAKRWRIGDGETWGVDGRTVEMVTGASRICRVE